MANPEHLEILKQGVDAWYLWRKKQKELRPDLSETDLASVELKGAYLNDTDLRGAGLWGADLHRVFLRRADLRGAILKDAHLVGSDLKDARLEGARLQDSNLTGSRLQNANLRGANLRGSDLSNTNLRGSNFQQANLRNVNLYRADLRGARLDSSDLQDARLQSTQLQSVYFPSAKFAETILVNVDLSVARGLGEVTHLGPSEISASTLYLSRGRIPGRFLRGCGLMDWEIKACALYDPKLTHEMITDTLYQLDNLRSGGPIHFFSCFLSYSHKDNRFAHGLHDQLQARGVRCWLDEHDLKPGDRILEVVGEAIRLHDRILLCCSEASLTSWWVREEIEKALERERREDRDIIIPLNLDGYLLDGWESEQASTIRSRLAADFTGWGYDSAKFDEQLEKVVRALRTDDGPAESD